MKKRILTVVLAAIVIFSTYSLANSGIITITAKQDSGININLNGKVFVPKEADGTINYPIVYKGRTYLPVRALAEAMDLPVDWDGKTRTVILGSTETASEIVVKKEQLFDVDGYALSKMHYTSIGETLNDFPYPTSYETGVIGEDERSNFDGGINTRGYKYLTGEANIKGYKKDVSNLLEEMTVEVYTYDPVESKKGSLIGKIDVTSKKPTEFKIDVEGVSEVMIYVQSMNVDPFYAKSKLILGDLKLTK